MSIQAEQLANRFREVILDGIWIANTNYKEQLEDLDWETATYILNGFNTISAISQHIHYYIKGVKCVLEGGDLEIRDKYSFDFPPFEKNEDWKEFLDHFWGDSEDFYKLIKKLPQAKLESDFVDKKYRSYRRNLEGMIEHAYYHLGQIVLIKKMVLSKSIHTSS